MHWQPRSGRSSIAAPTVPDNDTAPIDPTLITRDSDRRRVAIALYLLRSAAHRIAADCERMLESLHAPERKVWRDAVSDAFVASRHLLALLPRPDERQNVGRSADRMATLSAQVRDPQARIVDAMTALLRFVPVDPEDELLLHDARAIRQTALDLLVVRGDILVPSSERDRAHGGAAVVRDQASSPRILVADDEQMLRTALSRMLGKLGYDVVAAENGRAALDSIKRQRIDVVITDINMPELDGMELLRVLKADKETRDIPVIVVSSQDDLTSVARCIELGAEDHLGKPYQPTLLQARVRAALERKRMRDVELDYLRRVAEITSGAEAVERHVYVPGSLQHLATHGDELGRLARVFDRMVSGLRSREDRLKHRLRRLRFEMTETAATPRLTGESAAHGPFAPGEVLAGRYEIRAHIGTGGMGTVYRARDRELAEDIAIKVVRRDLLAEDPTLIERLKSEIRMARRISHPNVVRSHDIGESAGTYFITMEYVEGVTVGELIDRRGRLSIESTLAIGTQLADALAVAHEAHIVHRDIKPANLLIDRQGILKVMDFGLARPVKREKEVTAGGFIVGTPHYMSPEQFMGPHVDARSDLFSVGVVLYECLCGRTPFDGDSVITLFTQIVDGSPIPLGQLMPAAPPALQRVIHQLIERRPEDRIASAGELSHLLSEIEHAGQEDAAVTRVTEPPTVPRPISLVDLSLPTE